MEKRWKVEIEINASASGVDLERWQGILELSPRVVSETASVAVHGSRVLVSLIVQAERDKSVTYGPEEALKSALVLLRRSARRMRFTRSVMTVIDAVHVTGADLTPVPARKVPNE